MKMILTGNPPSTNHIYKMTCRGRFPNMYMSKEGKEIKESWQKQARLQYKGAPQGKSVEIKIYVKLFFQDNRKHDIDGSNKILLDSLNNIVWTDDSQIKKATFEKFIDRENPRVEIEIGYYTNDKI